MTAPALNQQIAIITGGGDGLGFALATRLVKDGVNVCLFDINEANLDRAKKTLGERCHAIKVDVTNVEAVTAATDAVAAKFGRLDILVNCAGITGKTNIKTHEVDPSDFDRVFTINVKGTFLTCRAALPHMLKNNYGRILNVASISGKDGNAGMLAYSSSKAAVVGLTKVMGKEYADTGVTINAIAPAVIRTEMVAQLPEAQVKYMTDKIPMKRCGSMEEFAAMAAFIISPENSFTTAFTFDLTGGRAVY
jgi:2-dehydro-3-deoxy-L-rhamnonate dehydrogenase (NAD+)